ncbi:nickel pincer cofactor biosynthesis protein LarB [Rhizobium sp. BG4]|uniref:nickel pincer cofactor biosynthesis protein LarB n=1 Tax=Rhizobium sp. BG4 TaxID=2613770 RepID=UPI00193CECFC|nr:nickel pincer cofactor biosynthesis protein LarB [Rhizobium sp. BG4]QRM46654.1 nickel pincer cofactor biosynthesis protein LarB [Rhizobium sp. BG4]
MSSTDTVFDFTRAERIGLSEAVFCAGKSPQQIAGILESARERDASLLLTRLDVAKYDALPAHLKAQTDWCDISKTAYFGQLPPLSLTGKVAIVSAGTSDAPAAREAERTLRHAGVECSFIIDVGVAGLWRLMDRVEDIRRFPIVIAVAGMDAALASVLGGLYGGALICVPTSVGYGAAEDGRTALNAMLASCAPGLLVTNIDNGYGAACAALRLLNTMQLR